MNYYYMIYLQYCSHNDALYMVMMMMIMMMMMRSVYMYVCMQVAVFMYDTIYV
jgi:hypothetical protein